MKNILPILVITMMLGYTLVGVFSVVGTVAAAAPAAPATGFQTDLKTNLETTGGTVGYAKGTGTGAELPKLIGQIIKVVLGFLGVVLLIIVVYAGFIWMTAGGEAKNVEKAQAWLKNAIIGLAITLAAYAITDFVIDKISAAVMAP